MNDWMLLHGLFATPSPAIAARRNNLSPAHGQKGRLC